MYCILNSASESGLTVEEVVRDFSTDENGPVNEKDKTCMMLNVCCFLLIEECRLDCSF